jgi:hypothetical protein
MVSPLEMASSSFLPCGDSNYSPINQYFYNPSKLLKSGSLSSSEFAKTHLVSYKKVSPTLKIVRGCKHIDLQTTGLQRIFSTQLPQTI